MTRVARRQTDARDPFRSAIAALVRDEVARALEDIPPADWVAASALRLTSRQARRLAAKEGIAATRIAGRVYLARADVDRLARENEIDLSSDADVADGVAADLAIAFGVAASGGGAR